MRGQLGSSIARGASCSAYVNATGANYGEYSRRFEESLPRANRMLGAKLDSSNMASLRRAGVRVNHMWHTLRVGETVRVTCGAPWVSLGKDCLVVETGNRQYQGPANLHGS